MVKLIENKLIWIPVRFEAQTRAIFLPTKELVTIRDCGFGTTITPTSDLVYAVSGADKPLFYARERQLVKDTKINRLLYL